MVTIIDYGIGNLRSLEKAFQAVGAAPVRSGDPVRDREDYAAACCAAPSSGSRHT